jgi:hypothetical protein
MSLRAAALIVRFGFSWWGLLATSGLSPSALLSLERSPAFLLGRSDAAVGGTGPWRVHKTIASVVVRRNGYGIDVGRLRC